MIRYLIVILTVAYSILVSYWGNLQTYGDLSKYRYVFESISFNSKNIVNFYVNMNQYDTLYEPLYAFYIYIFSRLFNYNFFFYSSASIFVFLLIVYNLVDKENKVNSIIFTLITSSSFYFYVLFTNIDRLKLAIISIFLGHLLRKSTRKYFNLIGNYFVVSSFMIQASSILVIIPYYALQSKQKAPNPHLNITNIGSKITGTIRNLVRLLSLKIKLSSILPCLLLFIMTIPFFLGIFDKKIAVYLFRDPFTIYSTAQIFFFAILFMLSSNVSNSRLKLNLNTFLSFIILVSSMIAVSLLIGLSRVNILCFYLSMLIFISNSSKSNFALKKLTLCLFSILWLYTLPSSVIYFDRIIQNGFGFAG